MEPGWRCTKAVKLGTAVIVSTIKKRRNGYHGNQRVSDLVTLTEVRTCYCQSWNNNPVFTRGIQNFLS